MLGRCVTHQTRCCCGGQTCEASDINNVRISSAYMITTPLFAHGLHRVTGWNGHRKNTTTGTGMVLFIGSSQNDHGSRTWLTLPEDIMVPWMAPLALDHHVPNTKAVRLPLPFKGRNPMKPTNKEACCDHSSTRLAWCSVRPVKPWDPTVANRSVVFTMSRRQTPRRGNVKRGFGCGVLWEHSDVEQIR